MAKTDDYRFRISQDELVTLYNNAEARKKAHAELTAKHQEVIGKCVHFDSEKEALQHAIKTIKAKHTDCQIWAQTEKKGNIIRIKNWWLVTDDWKVKQAADFLGLALMYDGIRMQKIISNDVSVDDVVAYY